jgi:hypothetical protein
MKNGHTKRKKGSVSNKNIKKLERCPLHFLRGENVMEHGARMQKIRTLSMTTNKLALYGFII